MLNETKLKLYLQNGANVLLEGAHGVGKTSVVKKIFEESGLKWKYYSAATMDPWVDFIGVPKSVSDEKGNQFLELVKPKELALDEVEVMFFDEFNRAPEKVINAVMELIQFRSINGKKFNNLKAIWAAINPYDEENTYTVINLDPAVIDRFPIKIKVPYELDPGYLYKTHGELAKPLIKWWENLSEKLKKQISPRRLDYAGWIYSIGGDLNDVLPKESNPMALLSLIKEMVLQNQIELIKKMTDAEKKEFFTLENTIKYAEELSSSGNTVKFFNKEFIERELQSDVNTKTKRNLIKYALSDDDFFKELSKASQDIIKTDVEVKKEMQQHKLAKLIPGINKIVENGLTFSNKVFLSRLANDLLYLVKKEGSSKVDINDIFELVLKSEDESGRKLKDEILDKLNSSFTSLSQSLPKEANQLFAGSFYSYIIKNEKVHGVDAFVKDVLAAANKTKGHQGTVKAYMFLLGLSEQDKDFINMLSKSKTDGIYSLEYKTISGAKQMKSFVQRYDSGGQDIFKLDALIGSKKAVSAEEQDFVDWFDKYARGNSSYDEKLDEEVSPSWPYRSAQPWDGFDKKKPKLK